MTVTVTASTVRLVSPQISVRTPEVRWPTKSPAEVCDCTFDSSAYLTDGGTVEFESITLEIMPNNLTATDGISDGTLLTWRFSGGTSGTDYGVWIQATTTTGVAIDEVVWMRCLQKSPNTSVWPPFVMGGSPVTNVLGLEGAITGTQLLAALIASGAVVLNGDYLCQPPTD
jgi:hypothetical protein